MTLPPAEQTHPQDPPFHGQVVVFTGKLASVGRRQAREIVERFGGVAADDVTARTTMLVVGAGSGSSGGGDPSPPGNTQSHCCPKQDRLSLVTR